LSLVQTEKKTILKHKKSSILSSCLPLKIHNQILFDEMSIAESMYQVHEMNLITYGYKRTSLLQPEKETISVPLLNWVK